MKSLYTVLLYGICAGANLDQPKLPTPKLPTPMFDVSFLPRAVVTERKFLRYDLNLPGYDIASAIDAVKIRPKHPSKSPTKLVLRLHTGGLEYFALRSAGATIESSANLQGGENVVLASNSSKTQQLPHGTYFKVKEEKGVFQISFTPRAMVLLRGQCTFHWINYYRL